MIRNFTIVFLVSTLASLPSSAQKIYPIGIRTSFVHGCITDGGDRKTITELDTRICLCMLDKVQEQFSLSDFLAMAPALGQEKAPKNRLVLFLEQQIPHCL